MDRAGAAQADAAAELGAGEFQVLAHHPEQRRVGVDIDALCLAIDRKRDRHSVSLPWQLLTRAGRPERHERATIFVFGAEAGIGRPIPSQGILVWKHYNELAPGWAAAPCDKVSWIGQRLRGGMTASAFLDGLFRTAIAAAHPSSCLPPHLPPPPQPGRLIVLAAGKAAGSMAEVAEARYTRTCRPDRLTGIAVARHGYGRPTQLIPMVEAGHPIPDAAGLAGRRAARSRLPTAPGADDLVLVLLSGGASANWIAPAQGLTLADKQAVTRALLRSGANIGEINTVRKHLSRIKGGRLARRGAAGARRDAGDLRRAGRRSRRDRLGADRARSVDARRRPRHRRALSSSICPRSSTRALADPNNETPEARRLRFSRRPQFKLIARPADAFRAAEQRGARGRLRMRHARRPARGRGARGRRRARRRARWRCNGRAAAR